jgi:hypothetical protein
MCGPLHEIPANRDPTYAQGTLITWLGPSCPGYESISEGHNFSKQQWWVDDFWQWNYLLHAPFHAIQEPF